MIVRLFALGPLAAVVWASLALGQVATPTLAPPDGATSGNPATLPFAPSGFAGALSGSGDADAVDVAGASLAGGDVETQQLHVRLVGQRWAAGLDGVTSRIDLDSTTATPFAFHTRDDTLRAALAVRIGDDLAVGLHGERITADGKSRVDSTLLGLGPGLVLEGEERRVTTLPLLGAVLRFGSVVYLGAAFGSERFQVEQTGTINSVPVGSFPYDAKRDVLRYGAGLMWLGKGGAAVRLEVAAERRDPYDGLDPFSGALAPGKDKHEATRAALDLRWGSLLLALSSRSDDSSDNGVKSQSGTQNGASLGWVPLVGWALTLSHLRNEIELSAPISGRQEFTIDSVALHRQF